MLRLGAGAVVSVMTVASLAVLALSIRADEWLIAVLLWAAIAWEAIPFLVLRPSRTPAERDLPSCRRRVTVAVHVGDEPADSARAGVAAAAGAGAAVVVATEQSRVDALGPLDVPCFVRGTVRESLAAAAAVVETDGLLVVSAGAFADMEVVERAAALLDDQRVGWVVGRAMPFNRDGYAPTAREGLDQLLRRRVRDGGTDIWEPNATMVRTALLRRSAERSWRPLGELLRQWRRRGCRGASVAATFAVRSVPVTADASWHDAVCRRRGLVADLADAAWTRGAPGRHRAAALLMRELSAWSLGVFLVAPVLMQHASRVPFQLPPLITALLIAVPAGARWGCWRWAYGVRARPLGDLLSAAYDAPASLLALPAAITRKVTPPRFTLLPPRPLAWVAPVLAVAAILVLLRDNGSPARSTVAATALIELMLLWLFGMHGVLQLLRARQTYRLRSELRVELAGIGGRTVDLSQRGLSVRGPYAGLHAGSRVPVTVVLDDHTELHADCIVRHIEVAERPRGAEQPDCVVGLEMSLSSGQIGTWAAQLGRIALGSGAAPVALSVSRPVHDARWLGRAVTSTAMTVIGLLAAVVLVLLVFDYRPMIVRSGSMRPTLQTGDLVIVRHIAASDLAVGVIASIDLVGDGGTTHRVVEVTSANGEITVITQGDANATGEQWVLRPDETVATVVARIPSIGRPIAWLDAERLRPVVVPGVFGLALAVAASGLRRRSRRAPDPRPSPG